MDDAFLTDEHKFAATTGSFQFVKDLNENIIDIDEVHTPQSTLFVLLRNQETYLASARKDKSSDSETSTKLGLAQESDDEILILES